MAEAKVRLSVDGVQSVVTGFKQVGSEVMEVAGSMSALSAISGALSVGALTGMVRAAIDAADNLNDLGKATSIAVDDLAGLDFASQQSGAELDAVAKGINKLAVEMGKDAEKFARLGVTAKSPIEAFKQMADVINGIADPQLRAAVANQAFGESWARLAPLLSEGGVKIGEMIEKGKQLSGMTQDMADKSDEFNDALSVLGTGIQGIRNRLAADLLPLLNVLAEDMAETATGVSDLDAKFNPLTETLRAVTVLGGNVAFVFKGVGTEIGAIMAQMRVLAGVADLINPVNAALESYYVAAGKPSRLKAAWEEFSRIGDMAKADAEERRRASDEWEKRVMQAGRATTAEAKVADDELTRIQNRSNAANEARARAFIDSQDRAKKAAEAAKKEEQERARILAELAGVNSDYMEQLSRLNRLRQDGAVSEERYVALVTELINKQPGAKKMMDEYKLAFGDSAKATQEASAAYEKFIATLTDGLGKLREDVRTQKDYNDRLGLSKEAIAALDAARLEEQATALEGIAIKKLDRDLDITQYNLYKAQAEELRKLAVLKREGAAKESILDEQEKIATESQKIWDNFGENVQRNLGDEMFGALDKAFNKTGDAFTRMILRMAAEAAAANLAEALFGAKGTQGGGWLGEIFGSMFNTVTVDTGGMGLTTGGPGLGDRGLGGGRAGGGPVRRGMLYPVNELGTEMLTIGNQDYLMMGADSGHVTPNKAVGGSNVKVDIHNYSGAPVNTKESTDSRGNRRVEVVVGELVGAEMNRPGSAANRAVRSGFGLQPSLVQR